MENWILAYETDELESEIKIERFDNSEIMHYRVNELYYIYGRINIEFAGRVFDEYEYKPIEAVTKLEPKLKNK